MQAEFFRLSKQSDTIAKAAYLLTKEVISMTISYSVLDLAPVTEGHTAAESLKRSADLARHAEEWGYKRYWLAEHHNMAGIASSATAVVIGHVAAATRTIRVGSGGIMLPNHAPLVIAEQFGTLESLFPSRIDLGLGRAPGTDQATMRALRRHNMSDGSDFPELLDELRGYFEGRNPIKAVPGDGLSVPIWLLGSSGFSARLAGELGLPFSFASHFAPENTAGAISLYRQHFQPSEALDKPYVMLGVNVIAADTDEEADMLSTSMKIQFLNLVRGKTMKLQPPVPSMDGIWSEFEKATLSQKFSASIIGSPDTIREKLKRFLAETEADELMINAQIYSHADRLRSYEIAADVLKKL